MVIVLFVVGLGLLIVGAEALVRGASKLAALFGISPLVVGLTVVAFGTSSPELAVSINAALNDQASIALGNVVGSNVFNVLFILGLSALIVPLVVNVQLILQEVPIMVGASLLLLVMALDGQLGLTDGLLLCTVLVAYTVFLVRQSRAETAAVQAEYAAELPPAQPASVSMLAATSRPVAAMPFLFTFIGVPLSLGGGGGACRLRRRPVFPVSVLGVRPRGSTPRTTLVRTCADGLHHARRGGVRGRFVMEL